MRKYAAMIAALMIVGAYLSEFTKNHVWFFAIAVVLLAIKPMIAYFGNNK